MNVWMLGGLCPGGIGELTWKPCRKEHVREVGDEMSERERQGVLVLGAK